MRKIKLLTAMALLVFVFSGCGGSASSDSEDTESALHDQIAECLAGHWILDETAVFTGTAIGTVNDAATTVRLDDITEFKMIFSDIAFASSSEESAGTGSVYYYYNSSAYDGDGNTYGNFKFKSYANGASTKTQSMTLTRESDTQWIFQGSSFTLTMNISSFSSGKMDIIIKGLGTLEGFDSSLEYTIQCSLIKTSTSTEIDDDHDDEDDETNTNIADILEGTWLFMTGEDSAATESASAIKDDGSKTKLTLKLASNVTLKISDINLEPDDNTTSLTGTVKIDYAQKWTAYDSNSTKKLVGDGAFTFSKSNATMKFLKSEDGYWRIEDTKNSNENIIITVKSNTEIQTVWTGTTTTLDANSYTYSITCLFRKQ